MSKEAQVVSAEDKILVENYIRKNIARLAPERSVLGGVWTVTEVKINNTSPVRPATEYI